MADGQRTPPQPIGSLLDALGVRCYLSEGELVSSAVVLIEVARPEGGSYMQALSSQGMSWITRTGMLDTAAWNEHASNRVGPAGGPHPPP